MPASDRACVPALTPAAADGWRMAATEVTFSDICVAEMLVADCFVHMIVVLSLYTA